jgi:hypothetical protein
MQAADADPTKARMSYGVPIRELPLAEGKSLPYVALADMQPEVAERFAKYVCPCACPSVPGQDAFYLHDWERWGRANYLGAERMKGEQMGGAKLR